MQLNLFEPSEDVKIDYKSDSSGSNGSNNGTNDNDIERKNKIKRLEAIDKDRQLDIFGPCEDVRGDYCGAACCYIASKQLTAEEARKFEHRNYEGEFFLKNDPVTDACVYLDRATRGCITYEDRPAVCSDYSCAKDRRIDNLVIMIKEQDLSLRRRVNADIREDIIRSHAEPEELLELLGL